jgi:hypothetical protein
MKTEIEDHISLHILIVIKSSSSSSSLQTNNLQLGFQNSPSHSRPEEVFPMWLPNVLNWTMGAIGSDVSNGQISGNN